jgi:DNA-binding GntR family transcriptional regulator
LDVSNAEVAYAAIKHQIVSLALPPGTTIREADLQEEFGIGRTPLREALHRLAQERLVEIFPRRTTVVAKLGLQDVRQIYELRSALESAAAGFAARRISTPSICQLQPIVESLNASRDSQDSARFLDLNQTFHRTIAECSQNQFLAEAIDRALDLNRWLWNTYFSTHAVRRESLFGHDPIVDAILVGDEAAARIAMDEHIRISKEELLRGL